MLDLALTTNAEKAKDSTEATRAITATDRSSRRLRVMVNSVSTPRIVTDGDLASNAASYAPPAWRPRVGGQTEASGRARRLPVKRACVGG
jgi:hypothetical protein